jgi:hypothetical protein
VKAFTLAAFSASSEALTATRNSIMKKSFVQLFACAASLGLGFLSSAFAQAPSIPVTDLAPGLLGSTYTGLDYGYTHHSSSAPNALHRWGFISSRPIYDELRNTDAAFRYNYTRGSSSGDLMQMHEVAASLQSYMIVGEAKPFVEGQVGWAWSRSGAGGQSGAMYSGTVGVELGVMPQVTFTPFLRFRSSPRFHADNWYYGAKLLRRFDVSWSGSVGLQLDDDSNAEFSIGVQRRF